MAKNIQKILFCPHAHTSFPFFSGGEKTTFLEGTNFVTKALGEGGRGEKKGWLVVGGSSSQDFFVVVA